MTQLKPVLRYEIQIKDMQKINEKLLPKRDKLFQTPSNFNQYNRIVVILLWSAANLHGKETALLTNAEVWQKPISMECLR